MARRAGMLTLGGQWAAFVTGTVVAAAGWGWAALLVAYFLASSALTRLGADRKTARAGSVLAGQRARDAWQVACNGGVFAVAVLAGGLTGDARASLAGLGALAAATADTWATEIGLLWGGTPRSILSGRPLPAGVSGGITLAGTVASALGAALVALAGAHLVEADSSFFVPVLLAGIGGSVADSVLGAAVQSKRWCEQCRTWTERRVHRCGYRTRHARGVRWMTNDTVNLLATVVGATLALALAAS